MTTTRRRPDPAADVPVHLTVPEAAAALRVGVSTLRTWIAQGTVEAVKPGRAYLIPRREIDRLLTPRPAVRLG